jgi:DNA invertase Pin-like site-specific DNA recombinase
MKKAIVLVRVSTTKQETEAQRNETITFAKRWGYSFDEIDVIENKESATQTEEMKGIKEMEESILNPSNNIKEVFVWEFTRIARRAKDAEQIRNFLEEHKVNLRTYKENFSLFNEAGEINMTSKIIFDIWKSVSENEGIVRNARIARGKRVSAQQFKFLGGIIPYGYKVNSETKSFEINPEQAEVIKLIYSLYSTGRFGEKSLYNDLLKRGINIKQTMLMKILANEKYTGNIVSEILGRKKVFPQKYPAIISDELYNQCREIAGKKVNRKYDKQRNKYKYYSNRVVKCGCCGKYLYVQMINKKLNLYCYVCSRRRYIPENETKCELGLQVPVSIIDSFALYYATNIQDKEMQQDSREIINRTKQSIAELNDKISNAGKQYELIKADIRKRLKKVLTSISDKDLNKLVEAEAETEKHRINKEVVVWEEQIKRHKQYISDKRKIGEHINIEAVLKDDAIFDRLLKEGIINYGKAKARYRNISEQERYELVHQYILEIICSKVEKCGVEITFKFVDGTSKKVYYYGRQKDKSKKLVSENGIPLDYDYFILQ